VDLNALSAKLMRAEMMGNAALAADLKAQLAAAQQQQQQQPQQQSHGNVQLLMSTTRDGSAAPFVRLWLKIILVVTCLFYSAVSRFEGTA
jgi:hypothetical protein